MNSEAIVIFASFRPLPEMGDELGELLSWMVGHSRSEPGCERYDLYREQEGESFHLIERYRDQEALDAHRATEHYLEYRQRVADLIEGGVRVTVLEPIDSAG